MNRGRDYKYKKYKLKTLIRSKKVEYVKTKVIKPKKYYSNYLAI